MELAVRVDATLRRALVIEKTLGIAGVDFVGVLGGEPHGGGVDGAIELLDIGVDDTWTR